MTSILAFFVLICVLVFVHEYGHFWAARRCGVQVLRFSIGFGKVLWRKTDKQGTEFAFSLIPLGGYVQMYNGEPDSRFSPEQAVNNKSVLQRAFIIIAGPMANFLFAIFVYWCVYLVGIPTIKPVVGEVIPQSIAQKAGIQPEFQFKKVEGRIVQNWEDATLALIGKVGSSQVEVVGSDIDDDIERRYWLDLSDWEIDATQNNPLTVLGIRPKGSIVEPIIKDVVENSAAANVGIQAGDKILKINQKDFDWLLLINQVQTGDTLSLMIERDGKISDFSLTPKKSEDNKRYVIGIIPTYKPLADKYRTELKYDMLTALEKAVYKLVSLVKTILQFIGNLFTGDLSLKNMGGPISMAKGAGATVEIGWVYYVSFMALISVNLGVMNLFPILPLDGGQLLLLGAEGIRGKPLSEKIQGYFQRLGIAFVISLMFFAFINDLIHF